MSRRSVWAVWLLAAPAFVAIWSGWVQLGGLTGFGKVQPLPGVWDALVIDSRITLPIGMEAYAALALRAWLDHRAPPTARRFARASAFTALGLGAAGQVAYHLMAAAGVTRAPWPVTAVVACLPVAVLGMGAALAHLLHAGPPAPQPAQAQQDSHAVEAARHHELVAANRPKDAPRETPGESPSRQGATPQRRSDALGLDTRSRVAKLAAERPDLPAGDVAVVLGVSARTARRHLATLRVADAPPDHEPGVRDSRPPDHDHEGGTVQGGDVDAQVLTHERTPA